MIIGVPKEMKDHEFRVSLSPDGVGTLCAAGHCVWVEPAAGEGSGFSDEEYRKAGARLAASATHLFQEAELIVKVKEPQPSEYALFRPGHTLFAYLHLAASRELTQALLDARVTAVAYETTEGRDGSLPMLTPMSEIAGRMAVQVGARYLERSQGGCGILLGGVPGVAPAHVVVLGSGVVGSAAIRTAVGLGAQVTVFSVDLDQLRRRAGARRQSTTVSVPVLGGSDEARVGHCRRVGGPRRLRRNHSSHESFRPRVSNRRCAALRRGQHARHRAANSHFCLDQCDPALYSPFSLHRRGTGNPLRSGPRAGRQRGERHDHL